MWIGGVNVQADDAAWRRTEELGPARVLQGEKRQVAALAEEFWDCHGSQGLEQYSLTVPLHIIWLFTDLDRCVSHRPLTGCKNRRSRNQQQRGRCSKDSNWHIWVICVHVILCIITNISSAGFIGNSSKKFGYFMVSPLGLDRKQMWKFWPTKKGLKQCFWTTQKNHEKLIVGGRGEGGINPYGQPDRKISVGFSTPL